MTDNEYPPIADVSQELGVPLTQRKMPDLANHVPSRRISLEEAKARGWSLFWATRPSTQATRSGALIVTASKKAKSRCIQKYELVTITRSPAVLRKTHSHS
jgi:hypothetical protein